MRRISMFVHLPRQVCMKSWYRISNTEIETPCTLCMKKMQVSWMRIRLDSGEFIRNMTSVSANCTNHLLGSDMFC